MYIQMHDVIKGVRRCAVASQWLALTQSCSLAIGPRQTYCAPADPLWPSMSKFGRVSKTHKKHGNFHNRGSSLLKLTPEMTTIGTHIVSKYQSCTSNISKVIAKRVLIKSFQDHLILRPLYISLGQN